MRVRSMHENVPHFLILFEATDETFGTSRDLRNRAMHVTWDRGLGPERHAPTLRRPHEPTKSWQATASKLPASLPAENQVRR